MADASEARPLAKAGYGLIPLRPGSKAPADRDWNKSAYDPEEVIAGAAASGGNVGVRLGRDDLVVDVDPRNFGEAPDGVDPFSELVLELGLDPGEWPRVRTGSGGDHYYLSKPPDLEVRGKLPGHPGVEFKTAGRQVVAPGSTHPDGGGYAWAEGAPGLDGLGAPQAPPALLEAVGRAAPGEASAGPGGGGEHDGEELALMLDALDPADFRDHDAWLRLMQACHHATAGDGLAEFVAWSTRDPGYADHGPVIERRWQSLRADGDGPMVTSRTLYRLLRENGAGAAVPRTSPAEDFPDGPDEVAEDAGGPERRIVEEMNRTFCAVLQGGVFQVFMEDHDDAFGRDVWSSMSREAFRHYFEDERVETPDRKRPVSKAELWLSSPRRRKYRGLTMDPEGRRENEGKLNLWRGWSVDPVPGDWSMMEELIARVLCGGDADAERYVRRWIAHMLQRPWETPEAAIAFRGAEGTGKGTLGRALMRVAGPHGLTVSSRAQLSGRFNSHLRNCVFLFADEAVWPGDKEGEGVLKQLITEPRISYEAKGKDIELGRNMVHLMLASNEDWVVPAGREARRFFVSDVSDARKGDRAFFGELWRQMDRGGLAAMAHDLLALDLGDWRPAVDIPQTAALGDQRVNSLDAPSKFWLSVLAEGKLPLASDPWARPDPSREPAAWAECPQELWRWDKSNLLINYEAFLKRNRLMSVRATHKALVDSGKRFGLELARRDGNSERVWVLPRLDEMRAAFELAVGAEDLFD